MMQSRKHPGVKGCKSEQAKAPLEAAELNEFSLDDRRYVVILVIVAIV